PRPPPQIIPAADPPAMRSDFRSDRGSSSASLGELDTPFAGAAGGPGAAGDVQHTIAAARVELEQGREDAGVEGAGRTARVRPGGEGGIDVEAGGSTGDPEPGAAHQLLEHASSGALRGNQCEGTRKKPDQPSHAVRALAPVTFSYPTPCFAEDLLRVGPADHQPEEVLDLRRHLRPSAPDFFLEALDLQADDLAETEAAWHTHADVLVLQHFLGAIHVTERLEQEKGEERSNRGRVVVPVRGTRSALRRGAAGFHRTGSHLWGSVASWCVLRSAEARRAPRRRGAALARAAPDGPRPT